MKKFELHSYVGIDYGRGLTNINLKTKIRFGVIHQNHILQEWADSSEPIYQYHCPDCNTYLKKGADAKRCPSCFKTIDTDNDFDFMEPSAYIYKKNGYFAHTSYDDGDIFIEKAPYFTYAVFCSPCAPGACSLSEPLIGTILNNRAYCFGPEWFENNIAPYPVYSVKTKKLVK